VLRPTDTGCGNKRMGEATARLCRAFKSATTRQTAASLALVRLTMSLRWPLGSLTRHKPGHSRSGSIVATNCDL
jgi:hypothetical protein